MSLRLGLMAALAALALGGVAFTPQPPSGALQRVGNWPGITRGAAWDIAVAGNTAYVAIGEGGLVILDVTDPAKPARVGAYLPPGRTEQVRVADSRVYVVTSVHRGGGCEQEAWRGKVLVLDASDPVRLKLLGTYTTSNQIKGFGIDGHLLCVSDVGNHQNAVYLVDVADPSRPIAQSVNASARANACEVIGNRLYLGNWTTFFVQDVSQPSAPADLFSSDVGLSGQIEAVTVQGPYLYLVGGAPGLFTTFEITTSSELRQLGAVEVGSEALGVQVDGNYAYVATGSDGLVVINIADPKKPLRIGQLDTPGICHRVKLANGQAFLADYSHGVQIVDLHDPAHPALAGSFDTGLTARRATVVGSKAYLLSSDTYTSASGAPPIGSRSRLEILDVTNPAQPALTGSHDLALQVTGLDVAGELAYLGWINGNQTGVDIVDCRDPARPARLSSTPNPHSGDVFGHVLRVRGTNLYSMANGLGLWIYDASDPLKLVLLSDNSGITGGNLSVVDNRAFVSLACEMQILDVADPKRPRQAGSVGLSQCGGGSDGLAVAGELACVGQGWNGFSLFKVHSPNNIEFTSEFDTLGEVHDLWSDGHQLFVAEGWEGLTLFDLADPARPAPIGRARTTGQAWGVQVSGNSAYLVEGGAGLTIFSLPTGPVSILASPASVTLPLGEQAELAVHTAGVGPLTYQWYRGESGDLTHPMTGANSAVFSVPAQRESTPYWVQVKGGGAANNSQTAWVQAVPPVSLELLSVWPGWLRGPAVDVQVTGNLAYLAVDRAGMWICDVSDPASPRILARHETKNYAAGLAIAGNLVFVSGNGLEVIDVSNSTAPVRIGYLDLGSYFSKLAVAGSNVYLVGDGLRIVDVSTPSRPKLAGSIGFGSARAVDVVPPYVYVAGGSPTRGFLTVVEASDPAKPKRLGTYETDGGFSAVSVRDTLAYVIAQSYSRNGGPEQPGALRIIDVSNPSLPVSTGILRFNGYPADLVVSDNRAYFAPTESGLFIADISTPATPQRLGTLGDIQNFSALAVTNSRAYLVRGEEGLQIIDVTQPSAPQPTGKIATGGYAEDVAVTGSYAYVADSLAGLEIVDVSDPKAPVLAGTDPSTGARSVAAAVDRPLVYTVWDTLRVMDVSNPAKPKRVGSSSEGIGGQVVLAGPYAYTSGEPFQAFHLTTSTNPTLAASYPLGGWGSSQGLTAAGSYVFLGQQWQGLQILDMKQLDQPQRLGVYYAEAPVTDVAVRGALGAITLGTELPGFELLDLSDPARPSRLALVSMALANNVALRSGYAFVTGIGLQVFDIGQPTNPVRVAGHDWGVETRGLYLANDLAFVAVGDRGLAIYRLTPQLQLDLLRIDATGLHFSWLGGPGIRLQKTDSLTPPAAWQDVEGSDGAANWRVPQGGGAAFFRLARP